MKKIYTTILAAVIASAVYAGQMNIGLEAGYDFTHLRKYVIETELNASELYATKVAHVTYQHNDVIDTYDEATINGRKQKQNKNTTATGRLPQMHGFHVGPTFDWRSTNVPSLGLRFGVQFVFLATGGNIFDTKMDRQARKEEYSDYDVSYYVTQLYRLQLPVRLSYTFKLKKDMELWIMTGPKFNIGLAMVSDEVDYSEKYGIDYKRHINYYTGKIKESYGDVKTTSEMTDKWKNTYKPFDASWGVGIGFSYKNFSFCTVYDMGISDMGCYKKQTDVDAGIEYSSLTYINQLQLVVSYTFKTKTKK